MYRAKPTPVPGIDPTFNRAGGSALFPTCTHTNVPGLGGRLVSTLAWRTGLWSRSSGGFTPDPGKTDGGLDGGGAVKPWVFDSVSLGPWSVASGVHQSRDPAAVAI